jgi:hypothetical protein
VNGQYRESVGIGGIVNRIIVVIALIAASAGAADKRVQIAKDEPEQSMPVVPYDVFIPNSPILRNLLLNAAGMKEPEPGRIRIPIPVDGVLYEVIVAKPGDARLLPIAKNDAD